METLLNPEYIRRANSASHFDAGDGIERDAKIRLAQFDTECSTDGLTDEQMQYLDERRLSQPAAWTVYAIIMAAHRNGINRIYRIRRRARRAFECVGIAYVAGRPIPQPMFQNALVAGAV